MPNFEIGDTVRITRDVWQRRRTKRGRIGEVLAAAAGDVGEVVDVYTIGGHAVEYGVLITGSVAEWTVTAMPDGVEAV